MTDRTCEACGGALVQRVGESHPRWSKRRFCSRRCFGYHRELRLPTAREMQVVRLVARGMSNPEIGAELGLSPLTVKQHLARVATKLGTGDRAGIVGVAILRGLLKVPVTGQPPRGFGKLLFDVLVRIARGMSNAEIGAELGVGLETVKSRVRRLFVVLGVRSREEAVVAGVACGALRLVPVRRRVAVAA